ncbi:hypothetical protein [Nostoc sp. JL33]|uniref:hypothetical protein n=1 Tax=Nostoc sp. JL33 TaxID=2815396 RepID=UPI0025D10801|nr:hypothetical protein [Nostoc sp. JL33]MBN3870222.1 hypothetical protein [Nostoc sp. JL33]
MRLVERHIIKTNHQFYKEIDDLAWRSKNLYNYANYLVRQSFIKDSAYLNNVAVFHLVKKHESYAALPAKVSNQVLMVLHRNWKSFFEAQKAYKQNPSKFHGRPKLPKYKDKFTSASSFLNLDPIPVYKKGEKHTFSGKRIKRAWYRSSEDKLIHADINASLNIIRKVVPATFSLGIEGIAVYPFRVTPGKVA